MREETLKNIQFMNAVAEELRRTDEESAASLTRAMVSDVEQSPQIDNLK